MTAKQTLSTRGILEETACVLPVSVILGNPRFSNCEHHGICQIDPIGADNPFCNCPHVAMAWLSFNDTGAVRLVFQESTIQPDTFDYHFSTGIFSVHADYALPAKVLAHDPHRRSALSITEGRYLVKRYSGRLEIAF